MAREVYAWPEEMSQTHRPRRCPGCGLFEIWDPKQADVVAP